MTSQSNYDPQSPQNPQNPQSPQNPQNPQNPQDSQNTPPRKRASRLLIGLTVGAAAVVVLVLALALTLGDAKTCVGTWKLVDMTSEGVSALEEGELDPDARLTMNSDGTGTIGGGGEFQDISWEPGPSVCVVTVLDLDLGEFEEKVPDDFEFAPMRFELDADRLTLQNVTYSMVLERQ